MGLIRFLLACVVILCHTSSIFGYRPIPADLAVQSFFVISGFYMSLILNEKYTDGANKLFFKNRALKIYPVYWLNLLFLVAWGVFVNTLGYPGTVWFYKYASPLSPVTWIFLIITNLFIVGLDFTFLLGIKHGQLYFTKKFYLSKPNVYLFGFNSIGWTVGLELLFYLLAPYVLRKRIIWIIAILLGSLTLRIMMAKNGLDGRPWDYMFFPTQLMYFMAGSISYRLYTWLQNNKLWNKLLKVQYYAMVLIILFYAYIFNNSIYSQVILFISLTLLVPASFQVSKSNIFDRYLANLSYPVYISQMAVINITKAKSFPKIGSVGLTTLLLTILASVIIYHLVTKPIERIRQRPFKLPK